MNKQEKEKYARLLKCLAQKASNAKRARIEKIVSELKMKTVYEKADAESDRTIKEVLDDIIFENLEQKAYSLLRNLSTSYSMGDYKELNIVGMKKNFELNTTKKYLGKARQYNSNIQYGHINLIMTMKEFQSAEIIAGLITIICAEVVPGIKKAIWYEEQGRKKAYQLVRVEGFLVNDEYHATSFTEAKNWLEKNKEHIRINERNKFRFFGFEHAKSVGMCRAGILAFARKNNLNPEYGYSYSYLLSIANSEKKFVERLLSN